VKVFILRFFPKFLCRKIAKNPKTKKNRSDYAKF